MIRRNIERKGTLRVNKSYEGQLIHEKLNKIIKTGAGIEKVTETRYAGGYEAGADIRTDRWDVALDGFIKGELIGRNQKEAALRKAALDEKPEVKKVEKAEGQQKDAVSNTKTEG